MSLVEPVPDAGARPFQVDIPQDQVDDMQRRVAQTRWPTRETVTDESQGVRLATMQAVAAHWSVVPSGGFFDARGIQLPMSVTVFPDEIYAAPERWAKRAFANLVYYKRHDVGGHFAAWEQPQLLAEDLRESFRSFR